MSNNILDICEKKYYNMKMKLKFIFGGDMGYKTKQGELITALLKQYSDKHLNADEIAELLREKGCSVGKATVYRNLDKLTAGGLVRRYTLEDGSPACYQYIGSDECREHFHLKCLRCGGVIHLECDYLGDLSSHLLEHHGFELDTSKIVLYGICEGCKGGEEYAAD